MKTFYQLIKKITVMVVLALLYMNPSLAHAASAVVVYTSDNDHQHYGDAVFPNEEYNYNFRLKNFGPDEALDTSITYRLSDNLSTTIGQCVDNPDDYQDCTLDAGNIAVNEEITISVPVTAFELFNNEWKAEAIVTATRANGSERSENIIEDTKLRPDLDVTFVDSKDPVRNGEEFRYIYTIKNNSPFKAENLIADYVIASTQCMDVISNPGVLTDIVRGNEGATYEWYAVTIDQIDGNGGIFTFDVVEKFVCLDQFYTYGSLQLINFVDGHLVYERHNIEITKQLRESNLEINIEVEKQVTQPGEENTYVTTVTNNGLHTAENVVFNSTYPGTIASISPSQGSCDSNTGQCQLGDIEAGASVTVTLTLVVDTEGEVVVSVIVSSDTLDVDESDNSASVTTEVISDPCKDTIICYMFDEGQESTLHDTSSLEKTLDFDIKKSNYQWVTDGLSVSKLTQLKIQDQKELNKFSKEFRKLENVTVNTIVDLDNDGVKEEIVILITDRKMQSVYLNGEVVTKDNLTKEQRYWVTDMTSYVKSNFNENISLKKGSYYQISVLID